MGSRRRRVVIELSRNHHKKLNIDFRPLSDVRGFEVLTKMKNAFKAHSASASEGVFMPFFFQ